MLLYQGKAQEVIDLLEGHAMGAFAATYNEILGDAYQALGRIEEAQLAYQAALLDPMSRVMVNQQVLQWKALDLPEVSAADTTAPDEPAEEPEAEDPTATAEEEASE